MEGANGANLRVSTTTNLTTTNTSSLNGIMKSEGGGGDYIVTSPPSPLVSSVSVPSSLSSSTTTTSTSVSANVTSQNTDSSKAQLEFSRCAAKIPQKKAEPTFFSTLNKVVQYIGSLFSLFSYIGSVLSRNKALEKFETGKVLGQTQMMKPWIKIQIKERIPQYVETYIKCQQESNKKTVLQNSKFSFLSQFLTCM